MKFRAKTNSKQQLDVDWDLVNTYLQRWKPGTLLEIEIKRKVAKKSDPLRKMYFAAVLPPFCEKIGYEPQEYLDVHKQLKIRYFENQPKLLEDCNMEPVYQDERGIYRNVPHVFHNDSKIPVPEKVKFVDWVIRLAAKEGLYIDNKGG